MRKPVLAAIALGLIGLSWLVGSMLADTTPQAVAVSGQVKTKSNPPNPARTTRPLSSVPEPSLVPDKVAPLVEVGSESLEQAEIERCKRVDIEHMTQLYRGIIAYLKKYGHYPEQLSQLVPEFATAEMLRSPRRKVDTSNSFFAAEHADPALAKPSYAFEFSNIVYRDGRTFAEIKEIQRTEWGDVVPMLRSFAYDKVINVSCRGDVYETQLNWEWDSATLDLAEKYGWGPGLNVGEMVKVRVLRPDGTPAAGAQVWADGRSYSFDLPNRPFTADGDGWATIPIGVDTDRTALVLRAEVPGYASSIHRSAPGELPQGQSLTLAPSQRIGGIAVGADGQPLPGARVFLKQTYAAAESDIRSKHPTISVVANAQGRWSAQVHPTEVASIAASIGEPGGTPFKYAKPGALLNVAAAKAGSAVVTVAPAK